MKRSLVSLLIVAIIAGTGYSWYHVAYSKCRVPIRYDVGAIDPHFDLTEDEVKSALSDAESLWEDATGKNLFTFAEGAPLVVNFIYDERQKETETQHKLTEVLDRKASMSASIKSDYEKLLSSYESLKADYTAKVTAYEKRLAAHNKAVEEWNTKGGAPEGVYAALQKTSASLSAESTSLNALAKSLNGLAGKINQVGEKGNAAVEDYNESVADFNDRYDDGREFTQGDYTGDAIHIYQYDDATELRRVLAHELGHALSLSHVADTEAIMHSVMEGDREGLALRYDDLAEYQRTCGTK
ncbi:MAG: hypothetical protein RLZZ234_334 [Candidatus Parcubacteria bacterium]|jgi:hypothetical protein